jgi:hypothetical protein
VPYQVRVEQAGPRVLAAVRAVTTPQQLGTDLIRALDQVWPVLREQGARTEHNVVIYHPGEAGMLTIDAGVEVFGGFEERGPANDRRQAGVNWEVYGDWDNDPAKRRTDVYKLLSPA